MVGLSIRTPISCLLPRLKSWTIHSALLQAKNYKIVPFLRVIFQLHLNYRSQNREDPPVRYLLHLILTKHIWHMKQLLSTSQIGWSPCILPMLTVLHQLSSAFHRTLLPQKRAAGVGVKFHLRHRIFFYKDYSVISLLRCISATRTYWTDFLHVRTLKTPMQRWKVKVTSARFEQN